MKLYDSLGPNPRLVRMFLAEKGITLSLEQIDLLAGKNRRPPYIDKNVAGQMPCLELDDGRIVAETIAICESLEEKHPKPTLVGATPEERAETRMWLRRNELGSTVGQPVDPKLAWVNGWMKRVAARPSATASLHPKAVAAGMRG